jgi:hypothetical protein
MPVFQIKTLSRNFYYADNDLSFEELQKQIELLTKISQQNQKIIFMGVLITPDNYSTMKINFPRDGHVLVLSN